MKFYWVLLFSGFALVVFFSSFHLFSSPETWMDEGLIIQSAIGLLHTGKTALPVAPGEFEPAWYITTGFPLTALLAGVFGVFGVSLEAARLVMLGLLLFLYIAFFLHVRHAMSSIVAWFSFFLLIFFAPIYGHGRNVLGEIPGLLFMLLALLPFLQGGEFNHKRALWVGLCAGLAFATKPIFILFLPALLLATFLRHGELKLEKVLIFGLFGVFLPFIVWIFFQFDHATLSRVLAVYANPHDVDVGSAIVANTKRLFTEMQPLYFLSALALWSVSYVVRRVRREAIPITEEALLFFSVLVFFAYLRTAGYYRYFFPAQVFAVLYLPQSLWYFAGGYNRSFLRTIIFCLSGLILFQAYETGFRSWTAIHYNSTRTEALERYFASLPAEEEIFVYQAPEIVPFTKGHPVYQYARITPSISFGDTYVDLVTTGRASLVITSIDFFQAHEKDIFSRYRIIKKVDNYVILTIEER